MTSRKRLTHTSLAAYRRLMQVSRAQVFIFIEGKTDIYFYNKISEAVFANRGIAYEISFAHEIPTSAVGKTSLIDFFDYLDKRASLLDDFKGKQTASIFFIDKDIDDLLNKRKTSAHAIYTEYYDVENYYFSVGNLVEALSGAASLDLRVVRAALPPSNDSWRRNVAEQWKDWVKLCILTRLYNIRCDSNYGVYSKVNAGFYAPTDTNSFSIRLADIEQQSGLTPLGFKRVYGRISRLVDGLYAAGQFDKVFKGKWYARFLAEDARRIAQGRTYNSSNLPERIKLALQMTIDFDDSWADYFKQPLEQIARNF